MKICTIMCTFNQYHTLTPPSKPLPPMWLDKKLYKLACFDCDPTLYPDISTINSSCHECSFNQAEAPFQKNTACWKSLQETSRVLTFKTRMSQQQAYYFGENVFIQNSQIYYSHDKRFLHMKTTSLLTVFIQHFCCGYFCRRQCRNHWNSNLITMNHIWKRDENLLWEGRLQANSSTTDLTFRLTMTKYL